MRNVAASRLNALWECLALRYDRLLKPLHWREVQLASAEGISGCVLDAGCGTAQLCLSLLERGLDAYGCDLSPAMLKAGRRKLAAFGHDSARLTQADITHLPYADGAFAYVLAAGVLCTLPQHLQSPALIELLRVSLRGVRLLEPLDVGSRRPLAWRMLERAAGMRPIPEAQLRQLGIPYRLGWSAFAGAISYIQLFKPS